MAQHYSNPNRESDPHALPDIEVFYAQCGHIGMDNCIGVAYQCEQPTGWYWQACFPGCTPEGEPNGPFDTEELALADAQDANSWIIPSKTLWNVQRFSCAGKLLDAYTLGHSALVALSRGPHGAFGFVASHVIVTRHPAAGSR